MPCYRPLKAYKQPGGGVAFDSKKGYIDRPVELRCGGCVGCRMARAKSWAVRCVHEAQLHERNCFVTLTYDRSSLPKDGGLHIEHWQNFAKKVRRRLGAFRFFMCGEYGSETLRPHFHILFFGLDFPDRMFYKGNGGSRLYTSKVLQEIWDRGYAPIGDVSVESAAYVARYQVKKQVKKDDTQYLRVDPVTGESWYVRREFVNMSRRPGIGSGWIEKYKTDVYPSDEVIINGHRYRPPSFYDSRLSELELREVKRRRLAAVDKEHATPERLRDREKVADSRLASLRRSL